MFPRLQPPTRACQLAARMEEWIRSGILSPGQKLPAERQLAEQIGVSRKVLRDAIVALQAQGLLTVRRGIGHYVANAGGHLQHFPRAVEALEALTSLAMAAISLTAFTSGRDLSELRQLVERMLSHQKKGYLTTVLTCTCDFHVALAQLADNPHLVACTVGAADSVRADLSDIRQHLSAEQADGICEAQARILQAVTESDPQLALAAVSDLIRVWRSLHLEPSVPPGNGKPGEWKHGWVI